MYKIHNLYKMKIRFKVKIKKVLIATNNSIKRIKLRSSIFKKIKSKN